MVMSKVYSAVTAIMVVLSKFLISLVDLQSQPRQPFCGCLGFFFGVSEIMKFCETAVLQFCLLGIFSIGLYGSDTVTISNDHLSVTLAEKGAELQSIRHVDTDTEYLWQGDPEYWAARSPNMFPVNVRFKDHRFTYKGKDYEMPFLGLVVDAKLPVKRVNKGRVVHVLESSKETLKYYPFPFRLEILSEVTELELIQRYTVTNTGKETMYFALGGHPGLNAPFIHGRTRSDYELCFSTKMNVDRTVISDGLQTDESIAFLHNEDRLSLGDPRVPDSGLFLRNHDSRQISLALKGRNPYVTVDLQDFPNTNMWSPPGMPYACIEPMVGHHDLVDSPLAIEEKSYLTKLSAGQSKSFQYRIIVHPKEGVRALK